MHIYPYVWCIHAICKTLFCYGIYNQNCAHSIVPASDIKGIWRSRHHSRLCWRNPALTAKSFGECQSSISLLRSRILSEISIDIWAQSVLWKNIPGNLWAITLYNVPRFKRNNFGVTFVSHIPCIIAIQECELLRSTPKHFLQITTLMLSDNEARIALSPHLVYKFAGRW